MVQGLGGLGEDLGSAPREVGALAAAARGGPTQVLACALWRPGEQPAGWGRGLPRGALVEAGAAQREATVPAPGWGSAGGERWQDLDTRNIFH